MSAVPRVALHDVARGGDQREYDDGNRNMDDGSRAPPSKPGIEARDRSTVVENERGAAPDGHTPQSDDEGRNAEQSDGPPLQVSRRRAHRGGRAQCNEPAQGEIGSERSRGVRSRHPGEGKQRSHRQIDAGGQNHEGHSDRDDAVDRALRQDVGQVAQRDEALVLVSKEDDQKRQKQHRSILAQPGDGIETPRHHIAIAGCGKAGVPRAMRSMSAASLASCADTTPFTRPSRKTTIRSLSAITSGSSEEITMTATPRSAMSQRSWCTSAFAPTSMPRVGSSTMMILGFSAMQRASSTFC